MPPTPKSSKKHENYEILNLIGYGLAKFNMDLPKQFGFETKAAFFNFLVDRRVAQTTGTIKNRQDLFDPLFPNSVRKGWWQSGQTYMHRKQFIDSQFGDLDARAFSEVIKLYLKDTLGVAPELEIKATPILRSRFKQLQLTGQEAEQFFLGNYQAIDVLSGGRIEDARLFGDGYDFQIEIPSRFILAEVKGLQTRRGGIRMTDKEFRKAEEHRDDYGLVVVSNMSDVPRMKFIPNPTQELKFRRQVVSAESVAYHTRALAW